MCTDGIPQNQFLGENNVFFLSLETYYQIHKNWQVWVCMSVILAFEKWRQENQELKVIINYTMSLTAVWALWDTVSKSQKPE